MIQINLLPPEYRPRSGTPVARFVAIVAGVILVAGAGGAYAYTHFIELAKVQELKEARDEERRAKEMQRDRSLALQREITVYEKRREAIQTINRSRTLWSRKLDQFFDIVTGQANEDAYKVWLETIEVPTQLSSGRTRRKSKNRKKRAVAESAGEFTFEGYMAMEDDQEALALGSAFHIAVTGAPETTGEPTDFFRDFMFITNPNVEIINSKSSDGERDLVPPVVGVFKAELKLKPVQTSKKKKQ